MRLNLINVIEKDRDLTNAIVLTHNIDFLFLQSVVLPALKRAGYPKLTIFADAHCASDTFATQAKFIDSIGIRYRVVPVSMEHGFRFHPKALMLSGQKEAKLFVGSGNLTYGGWVENAEIWVGFHTETDGTSALAWFKTYLDHLIGRIPFGSTVQSEIDEAFDGESHEWAGALQEPSGLIGKAGQGIALKDQMINILGTVKFKKSWICSPFFDDDAEALQELAQELGNPLTHLFIQNGRTSLNKEAASKLPRHIIPTPVELINKKEDEKHRTRYLHAKFYAFEQDGNVIVFAGSANCSLAALCIPGSAGNAELMAILRLSVDQFKDLFIDEFQVIEAAPVFSSQTLPTEKFDEIGKIQITAARYNGGQLLIGYSCPKSIKISNGLIDEKIPVNLEFLCQGEATVYYTSPPRFVRLEGINGDVKIHSNLGWVDHERELSSTSRIRFLAETIRTKVRSGYWGIGSWNEILNIFCKHLEYVPKVCAMVIKPKETAPVQKEFIFTEEDVFADGYGIAPLHSSAIRFFSPDLQIKNLRQLLLRWFGFAPEKETLDDTVSDEPEVEIDEEEDAPEKPLKSPITHAATVLKETPGYDSIVEKEKAKKFICKLTALFCHRKYLENRPPELLAADIKLMAALLIIGMRENWISPKDFIDCSTKIWSQLFFCSEVDRSMGWLEHRKICAGDSFEFISRMSSVEISAALAAWAFYLPLNFSSSDKTKFSIACIMSVARHTELWHGGSCDAIKSELKNKLLPLLIDKDRQEEFLSKFNKRWLILIQLGHAVSVFENALKGKNPCDFKDKIHINLIPRGELLWQGPTGFCVTLKQIERSSERLEKVVSLRNSDRPTEIFSEFMIPVRAILSETSIPEIYKIGLSHQKMINALACSIRKSVSTVGKNWYIQE